ncbi:MAG TPA: hypothetical protein VF427_09250 [Noviherbaspirillum sp.]
MAVFRKNKTFATFLAATVGGMGVHRFYLFGKNDAWGWTHLATIPCALFLMWLKPGQPLLFLTAPLVISILAALIEALVIGLTTDEEWDARHNPDSGRQSKSGWPLVILLVLTLGGGAIAAIATIARTFDLLFTGGAYG